MSIPSHPYVILNRNVLCNCDIEAESNFLLESLAACDEHDKPDLKMYFTVNLAFIDYLAQLNVTLNTPINGNWTNVKQPIPISLDSFQINPKLMHASIMLKRLHGTVSRKKNDNYQTGKLKIQIPKVHI